MAKRSSYRGVSAAQITNQYCITKAFWIALQVIAVLAVPVFLILPIVGKLSWFNGILCAFTALVIRYFFATLQGIRMTQFAVVLNHDCDPVKLEKIFTPLDKKPEVFNDVSLNMVRALFYQGRFQEALDRLLKTKKPDEKSAFFFQYYNMLGHCYDRLNDLEKLLAIRQKIENVSAKEKPKSLRQRQAQQLLTMLEIMILHKEGKITPCKAACKDMYTQASFALSRINVSLRLAELERLSGANHTASERCAYIIDDGGTTFYVEEAKKLYQLCCGREYVPEDAPHPTADDMDDLIDDEEWEDDDDTDEEYEDDDEEEN